MAHCDANDILVVDDGSTDFSAAEAGRRQVHIRRHARNSGKGKALCTGFEWAVDNGYDWIMTLEKVLSSLEESIKERTDEMLETARREAAAIIEEAEAEVQRHRSRKERDLEAVMADRRNRADDTLQLELERMGRRVQKDLVDRVFEETLHALETLPLNKRGKILVELLKTIPDADEGTVHCGADLMGPIEKQGFKVEVDSDVGPGLIISFRDGEMTVDCTFRTLLTEAWKDLRKEVVTELFDQDGN